MARASRKREATSVAADARTEYVTRMPDANPYAPPQAEERDEAKRGARGAFAGTPREWKTMEIFGLARKAVNAQIGVLAGSTLIALGAPQLVSMSVPRLFPAQGSAALLSAFATMMASLLLSSFFAAGSMKIWLDVARGKDANFTDLFGGASRTLPMLGTTLLLGLALGFGLVALVIPGLILMAGFSLALFFVVDANMGPMRALSASWEVTKGQRLALLGFWLVAYLVLIVGALACGIGILIAYPLVYVALAMIYLRASGRGKRKKKKRSSESADDDVTATA